MSMLEQAGHQNALAAGTQLAEYRIERVLGAGGFGITYLAIDGNLEKKVALKEFLPSSLAVRALDGSVVPVNTDQVHDYRWGLERFIAEARTLARFSHPHIVRVNRYFEANGTGYMVMDYEEGESFSAYLKREGELDETRLRAILMPLLDGLDAVHAAGFLHRDIKPSNLFIRADGRPLLIDFGASRRTSGATHALTAIVTPGYTSLEQYTRDGAQGPWSDIYSLAAVLFRAVTGAHPPDAISRMKQDAVPAQLAKARDRFGAALLAAIEHGLAVDDARRPRSVGAWRAEFAGEPPGRAPVPTDPAADPTSASPRVAPSSKPRRTGPVLPWLAGLLLAGGVLAVVWYALRSPPVPPVRPVASGVVQAGAEPAARASATERPPARSAAPPVPEPLAARFAAADRDGNGFLDRAELDAAFPRLAGRFDDVDADRDGRIAPAELSAGFRQLDLPGADRPGGAVRDVDGGPRAPARPQKDLATAFDEADADRDGTLTREEARARMPFLAGRFAEVDADGDGRITRRELLEYRNRRPPRP